MCCVRWSQLTKKEYNKQLDYIDVRNNIAGRNRLHTRALFADARRKLSKFSNFKRSQHTVSAEEECGGHHMDALRQQQQALAASLRSQMEERRARAPQSALTGVDPLKRPQETAAPFHASQRSASQGSGTAIRSSNKRAETQPCSSYRKGTPSASFQPCHIPRGARATAAVSP